jgi:hypothetical protein
MWRRISGPNGEDETGCWMKVHNGEPHNLLSSANIIRIIKSSRMRLAGNVERTGYAYRILVGKPEGNLSLGKSRHM